MPPASLKSPAWADTFAQFLTDSQKVPYEALAQHWRDSDWKYRLVQKSAVATPDGSVLVDTDLLIGPSYADLQPFDTVTIRLPNGPGPVTLVTRVQLEQSLIGVVFGRFPPAAQPANIVPPPAPGQMNGGEPRHVDMHDADVSLPGEGGEYVDPDRPSVDVVLKREPDGLPIFVDLYSLGDPTDDVLDSVLEEVRDFLALASSTQQIDAMAMKNPNMLTFVKDLGDSQDREALKAMVDKRRRELTIPAAAAAAVNAPRRRQRSQSN